MMALITVRREKRNDQRGRSFDLWAESIEGAERILMHVYARHSLIDKNRNRKSTDIIDINRFNPPITVSIDIGNR